MKIHLSIIILLLTFNSVLGCSYIGYPDPPTNYIAAKTGTIFIGKVISKSSTIQTEDGNKYRVYRIKFRVEKALKGVDNEIQEITLHKILSNRTSCTVDPSEFKKGEHWIIHRNFKDEPEVGPNLFGSSYFQPNWRYYPDVNRQYIEDLEKAIKNPVTSIYGQVQMIRGFYLPESVEVIAVGNELKLSAKTDKAGFYSFENVPAGNYKIQIRLFYQTKEFFHDIQTVFDSQTNKHNLNYEVSIKTGDADYHYFIVSEPPEK
jgi:hypothetical protein